jgi:hypothetical protein
MLEGFWNCFHIVYTGECTDRGAIIANVSTKILTRSCLSRDKPICTDFWLVIGQAHLAGSISIDGL